MAIDELQSRWQRAWAMVATAHKGQAVFASLIARYAEPHRAYHNLDHIRDCLRWLDWASRIVEQVEITELAIWFHDAFYDPRRNDNEERSAEWAERALRDNGAAAGVVGRVGRFIRLTTHREEGLSGDAAVLCDCDLAILGAEAARFNAYDSAIRLEYRWVPEDVFRRERGRVLMSFLARPRVYHTDFFRERLEEPARANLRRALARYSS